MRGGWSEEEEEGRGLIRLEQVLFVPGSFLFVARFANSGKFARKSRVLKRNNKNKTTTKKKKRKRKKKREKERERRNGPREGTPFPRYFCSFLRSFPS